MLGARTPRIMLPGNHLPEPPYEVADAVEAWARTSGRHARLSWVPEAGCWSVNLSARPDDPMRRAWQEGKLAEEPMEGVLLHAWSPKEGRYVPLDLEQYGASGIVSLLQRGDTWSGRGEFGSLQEAVTTAASRARTERERMKEKQRQWARHLAADVRRQVLKIPYLPVGVNLKERAAHAA